MWSSGDYNGAFLDRRMLAALFLSYWFHEGGYYRKFEGAKRVLKKTPHRSKAEHPFHAGVDWYVWLFLDLFWGSLLSGIVPRLHTLFDQWISRYMLCFQKYRWSTTSLSSTPHRCCHALYLFSNEQKVSLLGDYIANIPEHTRYSGFWRYTGNKFNRFSIRLCRALLLPGDFRVILGELIDTSEYYGYWNATKEIRITRANLWWV